MVNLRKSGAFIAGLLAATLALGMAGSAQAVQDNVVQSVNGSIANAIVGADVTVGNATPGCLDVTQCTFKFATTPENLGSGSANTGYYTFTVPEFGTYVVEITGKKGNDLYISTWTIVAPRPAAPSSDSDVAAKKYTVTVTGYTYKKKGMSTLDNNRAAAVSSYLRSLGLDDTNSDYVLAGVELTKNTKKARSAKIAVTYMKDGASVTVKKTIYFTAKKTTLSKKSKAALKKLATSVM